MTFGNGSVQSFAYDTASRLDTLTNNLGGAATTHDLTQTFTYNPASQIQSVARSNDAYAWQAHYNVDRSYVADGLNRIMNIGSTAFTYDARGNLTSDGTNSFAYSPENLMTDGPGGAKLKYDALGRLSAINTTAIPTPTGFAYDGIDRIAEYQGASTITARYVHGPGIDNPIAWYDGSAISNTTRRFLMADERGSVVSITDSAGATINLNAYDEYGIPAPGNVGKFGYTGQLWLPEVGMWYYKARMYSPTLGRFMQTDPIGYADGMNWYNYVGSDPVNFTDPTGLCVLGGQWGRDKEPCYDPRGLSDDELRRIAEAESRVDPDEIVVTAWKNGTFGGHNDPLGIEWIRFGYADGSSSDAGVQQKPINCGGVPHVAARPTTSPLAPLAWLAHGHQDLAPNKYAGSVYPGAGDGFTPALGQITNYMVSSTDVWAIRPDPIKGVGSIDHLEGVSPFPPQIEQMLRANAARAIKDKAKRKKTKPC